MRANGRKHMARPHVSQIYGFVTVRKIGSGDDHPRDAARNRTLYHCGAIAGKLVRLHMGMGINQHERTSRYAQHPVQAIGHQPVYEQLSDTVKYEV